MRGNVRHGQLTDIEIPTGIIIPFLNERRGFRCDLQPLPLGRNLSLVRTYFIKTASRSSSLRSSRCRPPACSISTNVSTYTEDAYPRSLPGPGRYRSANPFCPSPWLYSAISVSLPSAVWKRILIFWVEIWGKTHIFSRPVF